MKKSLIALFLVMIVAPFAFSQIQTVKVTGGEVQGVVAEGIASFKGIPFAAPPVDDLRWNALQPLKAWTGIRKTDAFAPARPVANLEKLKAFDGYYSWRREMAKKGSR